MKAKWKLLPFKTVKFKLYEETLERYKAYLLAKFGKGRTMQHDLEEYIINLLK